MRVVRRSLARLGLLFGVTVQAVAALAALPRLAWAQDVGILLRLNPHLGDTLHTWLDQQMEVTASMPSGASSSSPRTITTSMAIHSRTIVRSVQAASTTVMTIVDSALVSSNEARGSAQAADAQRAMRGQQMMLQLGADGSVESAWDARGVLVSKEAAQAMAAMPAVFPKTTVKVGDRWTREMPLPASGPFGSSGSGHARAVFHLDSIGRGNVAYVSMKGDILPDSGSQGVELSGSISGAMQIDRGRGWMTDSRFTVLLRSLVKPSLATGLIPMQFMTRVTQRLRTMDKR
ncbi:MAG: DUF6263 family protein [bacterium]